jgi:hypothetical protein
MTRTSVGTGSKLFKKKILNVFVDVDQKVLDGQGM